MNQYRVSLVDSFFKTEPCKKYSRCNPIMSNKNMTENREEIIKIKDDWIIEFDIRYNFLNNQIFKRSKMLRIGYIDKHNCKKRIVLYKIAAHVTKKILKKINEINNSLIKQFHQRLDNTKFLMFEKYGHTHTFLKINCYDFNNIFNFESDVEKKDILNEPVIVEDIWIGKPISSNDFMKQIRPTIFSDATASDMEPWIDEIDTHDLNYTFTYNGKEKKNHVKKFMHIFGSGIKASNQYVHISYYRHYPISIHRQMFYNPDTLMFYLMFKHYDCSTCAGNCLYVSIEKFRIKDYERVVDSMEQNVMKELMEPYNQKILECINDTCTGYSDIDSDTNSFY